MNLSQLASLPDGTTLPVSAVRKAFDDLKAELVSVAVQRELTLQMWETICTTHIEEDTWENDPTPPIRANGRTPSAPGD